MNDMMHVTGVPSAVASDLANLHAVGLRMEWAPAFRGEEFLTLSAAGVGIDEAEAGGWTCSWTFFVPDGPVSAANSPSWMRRSIPCSTSVATAVPTP